MVNVSVAAIDKVMPRCALCSAFSCPGGQADVLKTVLVDARPQPRGQKFAIDKHHLEKWRSNYYSNLHDN